MTPVRRRGRAVAELRAPQLAGTAPVVLLPLGAVRAHGDHLPLSTDGVVAESVAREASVVLSGGGRDVVVAPTVPWSVAGPGPGGSTVSVSVEDDVLEALLVSLGRSLCGWAGQVVVVNGYAPAEPVVVAAVARLRAAGLPVSWLSCSLPADQGHGGRAESGLLMALAPWTVRTDVLEPGPLAAELEGTTADEGRTVLRAVVRTVSLSVATGSPDASGRLRPAPRPDAEPATADAAPDRGTDHRTSCPATGPTTGPTVLVSA